MTDSQDFNKALFQPKLRLAFLNYSAITKKQPHFIGFSTSHIMYGGIDSPGSIATSLRLSVSHATVRCFRSVILLLGLLVACTQATPKNLELN